MGAPDNLSASRWPVIRQLRNRDLFGLDGSARSSRTESLIARTEKADRVVESVCPYCAVGCAQLVYVKDEKIIDIEGDPASPVSNGAGSVLVIVPGKTKTITAPRCAAPWPSLTSVARRWTTRKTI